MSFLSHSLDKGISPSSVLCNLHFSTPISELSGKGLFGCLSPITDSWLNNFLSIFGCVWRMNIKNFQLSSIVQTQIDKLLLVFD